MDDETKGSHRTRSRAAPDWTAEESLILLNEISAVESEWGSNLSSFQKWQQIVENCNALDVSRNLNQCKRQWDALLTHYWRIKNGDEANGSLAVELVKAIDICLLTRGIKNGAGGSEEEFAALHEAEPAFMGTDPDSDPEAQGRATKFCLETGSKKKRCRMKRKKRRVGRLNPWGYFTSPKINHEETSDMHKKAGDKNRNNAESAIDIKMGLKEQTMATSLWENAQEINRILAGNLVDDGSHKMADKNNPEAVQIDFTRRQGDKLIDCLGKISETLKQLCDSVQRCN